MLKVAGLIFIIATLLLTLSTNCLAFSLQELAELQQPVAKANLYDAAAVNGNKGMLNSLAAKVAQLSQQPAMSENDAVSAPVKYQLSNNKTLSFFKHSTVSYQVNPRLQLHYQVKGGKTMLGSHMVKMNYRF